MADLKISELPALAGTLLSATDLLALADLSASETKKITAKDLIQASVALIDDASIPGNKVSLTIAPGSIGTTELANGAVTAAKLADQSSAVVQAGLPAAGAYVGQMAVNTTDNKAYIWNGSAWDPFKGAGSINTLTYNNTVGPIAIAGAVTGDNVELGVSPKGTTAAAQFLAGPTGAGGTVDYRSIVGTDLPTATTTTKGAVVVNGFGLKVDGDRIQIDNAVTASVTYGVVTYDGNGLVTGGRAITGSDVPLAATASVGVIALGTQFGISSGGALLHANTVAAGSAAKVAYDVSGHITQALSLDAADIPNLDAAKITTGTFAPTLFGTGQITREMLADYSISYIQEATPQLTSNHIGVLWFQESTAQLSMWNGNSWFPIGQARLTAENLRYCGTIDATTGFVTGVTAFGTAAGYTVGDALKTATDQQTGVYFVVDTAGANISKVPGVTFDAGDWVLCNGAVSGTGYVRIDTLSGAGGGGASKLGDLLDVTLTAPVTGDVLQFGSGGQWVNVKEFDEGTYP